MRTPALEKAEEPSVEEEFGTAGGGGGDGDGVDEEDAYYLGVPKTLLFNTSRGHGLSNEEAAVRLEKFGKNALEEKVKNKWVALLMEFVKPMPIMIWMAIAIECAIKDWENVAVLFTLQLLNAFVGWYEDTKAGDAVAALRYVSIPKKTPPPSVHSLSLLPSSRSGVDWWW